MGKNVGKNNWALFLLLLAGIVLGSFIAQMTAGLPGFSWLNYGQKFIYRIPQNVYHINSSIFDISCLPVRQSLIETF